MLQKSSPVIGILTAVLMLAGCGSGSQPQHEPPEPTVEEVTTPSPPPEPAAEPARYRDTVNTDSGAELLGNDRFREFLAEHDGESVVLDVVVFRNRAQGDMAPAPVYAGRDGDWAVTLPDGPVDHGGAYFTFTVAEELFPHEIGEWVPLVGEFTITATEATGAPVFMLEATGDAVEPSPVPGDEARCTSETVEPDVYAAAERLAQDSRSYPTVQEEWNDAPRLWWAVKSTADIIESSDGREYGDALSRVCGDYWAS